MYYARIPLDPTIIIEIKRLEDLFQDTRCGKCLQR